MLEKLPLRRMCLSTSPLALHMALECQADPRQENEPEQEERLVEQVKPFALLLQVVELQDLAHREANVSQSAGHAAYL